MELMNNRSVALGHSRRRAIASAVSKVVQPVRAQATSGLARGAQQQSSMRVIESGKGSEKPLPEGPFMWPIVGETSALLKDGWLRFGLERTLKYGHVFRTSLFGMDLVMVTSPSLYKAVMAEDTKLVNFDMGGAFTKLQGEFNMDVLTNKNNGRMPFRRTMLAAVTQDAIAGYVPKMMGIAEASVKFIASQPSFEINVEARKWGMAYANALLAGMKTDGEEDEKRLRDDLAVFFDGVMTYDIDLPGTPLRKALEAKDRLLTRIKQSIKAQLTEILKESPAPTSGPKVRKNMLGYVIAGQRDEGVELSEEFLANMALSLLQAGTDTSSAGFAGLFAILAQRPDLWSQIREEQRQVIQQHGPTVTKAALDASRILDAAVRESVRMNPPGAGQYRRTLQEMELEGKRIPKGTMLCFLTSVMQGLEIEPEWRARARAAVDAGQPLPIPQGTDINSIAKDFVPERWMVADPAQRPSLFTFGHGPHTCLGIALYVNEAKTLLAELVRGYDIELLTKEFSWLELPAVKPDNGVMMRVKPIENPLV